MDQRFFSKNTSKVRAGLLILMVLVNTAQALDGRWQVLVANAGIAAMHTQVTKFGTVIFLDRTNVGPSQIALPAGKCRDNPLDLVSTHDCTARSVELTLGSNKIRPLPGIVTDTWCSSGQVRTDGTLVETGGWGEGYYKVRTFVPCAPGGTCAWVESATTLHAPRWYASNHILEDGTEIIVGGQGVYTMEFMPDNGRGQTEIALLRATRDSEYDNLYPFVNLLPSGNLWIFANQDSIIYDYKKKTVVRKLPTLQGGPRSYPSTGSSVMLPLLNAGGFATVQVLVCGGAKKGAFNNPDKQYAATQTCGRMILTAANPVWVMETMPYRRTLGDMVLLPTKDVMIINGAQNGAAGWGGASNPALNPILYSPYNTLGNRFVVQNPSTIPRMYHSTASLLPDGRIVVAGSNPHQFDTFTGRYPTELRVEAFSPKYLNSNLNHVRPSVKTSPKHVTYGSTFIITFSLATAPGSIQVNIASTPYATHSYSQGQRLLVLKTTRATSTGTLDMYQVAVAAPPNARVAPPAYYMAFVLNSGIPSVSTWIQVTG